LRSGLGIVAAYVIGENLTHRFMALFPRVVSRSSNSIEPLEARIAPALLINGANLIVAGSSNSTGETSVGDNNVELVKVTSGSAIVWYNDGVVQAISFGPNTSLEVVGGVGSLIGNLLSNGRLSDSDRNPANGEDGEVLLPNNLTGLTVRPLLGNEAVIGSIITGGSIQNVTIDGRISGIYAGDGAFYDDSALLDSGVVSVSLNGLDYNPVTPGVDDSFDLKLADAQSNGLLPGASIQNLKITKADQLQVFAGSGDPNGNGSGANRGAGGGSIRNVLIDTAFAGVNGGISYELRAGDGASAQKGGAGGAISQVVEKSSTGQVIMTAGAGGNGSNGAGGSGGSISDLDIQSDSTVYEVIAGVGGNGSPGGAGGSVKNTSFANRTPVGGVILAADFTGDGKDDVLVADQGTGKMIVYENIGDGANFLPIQQYTNEENEAVFLIDALGGGQTPSDALAADYDGDGDLDVVVAYKNSNSVGVFFNQGTGTFWDPTLLEGEGAFDGISTGLELSPTKLARLDQTGGRIAVAGTAEGKGAVQLLVRANGEAGPAIGVAAGINAFKLPVADIVGSVNGALFVATTDGKIQQLSVSGLEDAPFNVTDTGVVITGGVDDLDMNSEGTRLLALSTVSKSLTVYQVNASVGDGLLTSPISLSLSQGPGKALVAKFVRDTSAAEDRIAVLNSVSAGARMDLYNPVVVPGGSVATSYVFGRSLATDQTLNLFVPAYSDTGPAGFAALGGSLTEFTFGDDFLQLRDYDLPFAEKEVSVKAGDGGTAFDLPGKKPAKGGAGGNIAGLNADAYRISAEAGTGGDSESGPGGAGGSIDNKASFVTVGGVALKPTLVADAFVTLLAGNGGTPSAVGSTASGGAGGRISDIDAQLSAGQLVEILGGNGGASRGGAAGAGGGLSSITTKTSGGTLFASAGVGGVALSNQGAGGAGGSVQGFSHTSDLQEEAELSENAIEITIQAGAGGTSIGAAGGAGGAVSGVTLVLDAANTTFDDPSATPPLVDANRDSTVYTSIIAGAGAAGAKGGAGGTVSGLRYDSVLDQEYRNRIVTNFFTLNVIAGAGGEGTQGNGGHGGSIALKAPISGITLFDNDAPTPVDNIDFVPLVLTAGAGGNGTAKGGNGGAISGLIAQNSLIFDGSVAVGTLLFGAKLTAGDGGEGGSKDGGAGGAVTGSLVGVEGGFLQVKAGAGGNSIDARGGAGGAIAKSEYGVVSTFFNAGMLISAGNGGSGPAGGGAGGAVSTLSVNTSQSTFVPSALIVAGAGGSANSANGVGGAGGSIKGVSQAKDVNSSINLIQAGNGGDNPLGRAGEGGSVSNLRTVGFIGRPSDGFDQLGVFDTIITDFGGVEVPSDIFFDNGDGSATFAQGLFVGRGGSGATAGKNGSVSDVAARQIAAIAAAMDPSTQLFASVAKITGLRADLVGFDVEGNSVFNDSLGGSVSPKTEIPLDGFVLSASQLTAAQGIAPAILARGSFLLVG
jgi:hypothetical protein